jgi:hypothetical protein
LLKLLVSWLFISPLATSSTTSTTTSQLTERDTSTHEYDVVIYGNTVAALAAAIQTIRMGKTAVVVSPRSTLGGLTTSGLGWTDAKDGRAVTGIAREFYGKVFDRYQNDSLWTQEPRQTYVDRRIRAQPGLAIDEERKLQWTFEPKVAEAIWEDWVKEEKVPIFRSTAIKRSKDGVTKDGATITSLVSENGTEFRGKMFIDAGYEGDLMHVAGIPWSIGRESEEEYNESTAGTRINGFGKRSVDIDPYVKKGDPESGLIEGIQRVIEDPESVEGKADDLRIQAYNYRLCLTREKDNQVPFSKPDDYREETYEILFRYIDTGYRGKFFTASPMPNFKTDTNSAGQVSTDLLGGCFNKDSSYPDWSYKEREESAQVHKTWTQGLLYTLANHERVPKSIRDNVGAWGYAKDEFVSNDNWPYELYIREGRRMRGVYTMKQSDITSPKDFSNDGVAAMGSYRFDVHRVERVVVDNQTYNEGEVGGPKIAPFPIPYNAIVPEAKDATNFLNPITLSSSHIAFSAIRMEPTYMMLGQSAGTAAVLAIEKGVTVQDLDRGNLSKTLKANGEIDSAGCATGATGIAGLCVVVSFLYAVISSA